LTARQRTRVTAQIRKMGTDLGRKVILGIGQFFSPLFSFYGNQTLSGVFGSI
jgi:hypothetical protein